MPFLSDGQIKKNKFEDAKDLLLEKQKSYGSSSEKKTEEKKDEVMSSDGGDKPEVKELMEMGFKRE